MDAGFFAKGVTYDASPAGGSESGCVPNVKAGWKLLDSLKETKEGEWWCCFGLMQGLLDGSCCTPFCKTTEGQD